MPAGGEGAACDGGAEVAACRVSGEESGWSSVDPSALARRTRAEPRDGAWRRRRAASVSWTRAAEVGASDAGPVASGAAKRVSSSWRRASSLVTGLAVSSSSSL